MRRRRVVPTKSLVVSLTSVVTVIWPLLILAKPALDSRLGLFVDNRHRRDIWPAPDLFPHGAHRGGLFVAPVLDVRDIAAVALLIKSLHGRGLDRLGQLGAGLREVLQRTLHVAVRHRLAVSFHDVANLGIYCAHFIPPRASIESVTI